MDVPIRLVCFDLGRVLIRICDGWPHACELTGIALPERLNDPAVASMLREVGHRHELGRIDDAGFFLEAAEVAGLTPEEVRRLSDGWLRGPFPGVDALLDELREAGIRTACLSNTNANHWRAMMAPDGPNALPLARLDFRFASHLLGVAKPDPAIYAHVERTTGVPGEAIVFFDDLPANVDAASQRGWKAHWIDPARDPIEQARSTLARYDVGPIRGGAER